MRIKELPQGLASAQIKSSAAEHSFPPPNFGRDATVTRVFDLLPAAADYGELQVTVDMTHPSYERSFQYGFRVKTGAMQHRLYEVLAAHVGERLHKIGELDVSEVGLEMVRQ